MKALFFFIFWLLVFGGLFAQSGGRITPGTHTIPSGGSVTLTHYDAVGVTSRQWQQSINGGQWTNILKANRPTLSTGGLFNNGTANITRSYRVRTNLGYSSVAVITINPAQVNNPGSVIPMTQTIASGSSLTLTHHGEVGVVTSRRWQQRISGGVWTDIPNANESVLNMGTLTNNGSANVTREFQVITNLGTSAVSRIVVIPLPANAGHISPASPTIYSGGFVVLTHQGSSGVTFRQWQRSTDGGHTWTSIFKNNRDTRNTGGLFNHGTAPITRKYRVWTGSNHSDIAVITINPQPGSALGNVTPATQTISSGDFVTLTHQGGVGVVSRQWQQSTDGGITWANVTGQTAATFSAGGIVNVGTTNMVFRYRVLANGNLVSTFSTITVRPPTPGAPKVISSGDSVTLTHPSSPSTTSYQWQMFCSVRGEWVDIPGANLPSFNTGALIGSGDHKFRLRINGGESYSAEKVIRIPHRTIFSYDASGNRIGRRTIVLSIPQSMPFAPNRVGGVVDSTDDSAESVEYYFGALNVMEMSENNEIFETFYTDKLNESDVLIFPNPTRGALAVEILNKNPNVPHQITVFSLNGLIVFQKNVIEHFTGIDLSSQPSGIYLLRISTPDSFITWTIIKE